jgi:predicted phosphate transport protein (TIGR00153 family)
MEELHSTFVTPLDREDIALLANRLDDMLDYIEDAANALQLYRVEQPTQRAKELAAILVKMAGQLEEAMPLLRKRSDMKKVIKICIEINRLENEADHVTRMAMAEIFESMELPEVIKWREIYRHLEDAADMGEDVANVLEGVVLKHG